MTSPRFEPTQETSQLDTTVSSSSSLQLSDTEVQAKQNSPKPAAIVIGSNEGYSAAVRKEIAAQIGAFGVLRIVSEYGPQASINGVDIGSQFVPVGMDAETYRNWFMGAAIGVVNASVFRMLMSDSISWAKAAKSTALNLACAAAATGIAYGFSTLGGLDAKNVNKEILAGVEVVAPTVVVGLVSLGLFAFKNRSKKPSLSVNSNPGDAYALISDDVEAARDVNAVDANVTATRMGGKR